MKNREIKFRAYDKNKNKLIFGPTDSNPQPSWVLICCGCNDLPLMQYTGLKNKNGKEIYEGDLFMIGGLIYILEWGDGSFWLCCTEKEDNQQINDFVEADSIVDFEIIGNIHQNPELLK